MVLVWSFLSVSFFDWEWYAVLGSATHRLLSVGNFIVMRRETPGTEYEKNDQDLLTCTGYGV